MSEGQQVESYTWEINGRRAINPDIFLQNAADNGYDLHLDDPLIMIDCPRGAHPGKARLLLSKEDATAVLALTSPQTITVKQHQPTVGNDGTVQWQQKEAFEFKGYYVLSSKDALGLNEQYVLVTLADARYILQQTFVRKQYNVRMNNTDYDPGTVIGSSTPYTYQQIANNLASVLFSPPTLTLPVVYPEPENLIFDCSLADAIEQLLGSLGCALTYNPLLNSYQVIDLAGSNSLVTTTQAKNEGRLIAKAKVKASALQPDRLNIRPAGIVELNDSAKELPARTIPIQIGTGTETIDIDDHQITCDTTRIINAINGWYGELNYLLDETYYGILKQPPAEHLSDVRWYFQDGATQTRIQNRQPARIPWPKQPMLASSEAGEESDKYAFLFQAVLGTRSGSGSDPETKFPAWNGDATTAYLDGGTLTNLSPQPYTTYTPFSTCKNTRKLNGETGDTVIITRDQDTGNYELMLVIPKNATLFFRLTADRPNGLWDVDMTVEIISWRHPGVGTDTQGEGTLKVNDTFGRAINAKTNMQGYAEWNVFAGCWTVIACQVYATRIQGTATSGSGSPRNCNPVIGFNGFIDVLDTQSVILPSGWPTVPTSANVWYDLDPLTGNWIAFQANVSCSG